MRRRADEPSLSSMNCVADSLNRGVAEHGVVYWNPAGSAIGDIPNFSWLWKIK